MKGFSLIRGIRLASKRYGDAFTNGRLCTSSKLSLWTLALRMRRELSVYHSHVRYLPEGMNAPYNDVFLLSKSAGPDFSPCCSIDRPHVSSSQGTGHSEGLE